MTIKWTIVLTLLLLQFSCERVSQASTDNKMTEQSKNNAVVSIKFLRNVLGKPPQFITYVEFSAVNRSSENIWLIVPAILNPTIPETFTEVEELHLTQNEKDQRYIKIFMKDMAFALFDLASGDSIAVSNWKFSNRGKPESTLSAALVQNILLEDGRSLRELTAPNAPLALPRDRPERTAALLNTFRPVEPIDLTFENVILKKVFLNDAPSE